MPQGWQGSILCSSKPFLVDSLPGCTTSCIAPAHGRMRLWPWAYSIAEFLLLQGGRGMCNAIKALAALSFTVWKSNIYSGIRDAIVPGEMLIDIYTHIKTVIVIFHEDLKIELCCCIHILRRLTVIHCRLKKDAFFLLENKLCLAN